MTIDEAIEIKEAVYKDPWLAPKGRLGEADKLSIEALKAYGEVRKHYPIGTIYLLPGETEEKKGHEQSS